MNGNREFLVMKQTDPMCRYEDELIAAVRPTIQTYAEKRLAEIRHAIVELEVHTSALASVIAIMSQAGADTVDAEERFAAMFDELMELRLDEGSLKFLTQACGYN